MASNSTCFAKKKRNIRGLTSVLKSAACEWLLIGLMLCNAVISYFATKFARYGELQVPCILCSRLDHILGNERPGFYRNLLCGKHRSEISLLVACHLHGKVADGNRMCEECLFSFLLVTQADTNAHRALLGKIGFDSGCHTPKSFLFNPDYAPTIVGTRLCSCCKKPWISRQNTQKLFHIKSPKPDIPLPRRLTHRGNIRRIRERLSKPGEAHNLRGNRYDPMSHIGYCELKITSDSESDFPCSDDDELSFNVLQTNEINEECNVEEAPKSSSNTLATDVSTETSCDPSKQGTRLPDAVAGVSVDVQCLIHESGTPVELGESDSKHADTERFSSSSPPELISLDDLPSSSVPGSSFGVSSANESETKVLASERPYPSVLSDLVSLVEAPSLLHASSGPVEASQKKEADESATIGFRNTSMNKYEEILKSLSTVAEAGFRIDKVANEVSPLSSTFFPLTNMRKPNVLDEEDKEKSSTKDECFNAHVIRSSSTEDASNKDVQSSLVSNTLEIHGIPDKQQMIGPSSTREAQVQQESSPGDRAISPACESLDGSYLSETEGENAIDQLKKQIEQDKKRISSLVAELEEERNAAAIAANQAMAMITRLQEEKATLHMEALQYLRMMEEQAEYDVETLEKANDLLAEREKEIQDMEAELELLRLQLPESAENMTPNVGDSVLEEAMQVDNNHRISHLETNDDVTCPSTITNPGTNGNGKGDQLAWPVFEDEKLFISKSLKEIERRLRQFTSLPSSPCLSDNDQPEEKGNEENGKEGSLEEQIQVNGHDSETRTSLHLGSNLQVSTVESNGVDLVTIENELTDLHERLEAVEANWYFLEHTVNCLHSGSEGLRFIQDIAHQLQELRQIGLRTHIKDRNFRINS